MAAVEASSDDWADVHGSSQSHRVETIHRSESRLHTHASRNAARRWLSVDAVVGLLDGVRARGAFCLRMMLDPPWSMSIRDEAPLTLICQTHGRAAIVAEGGANRRG